MKKATGIVPTRIKHKHRKNMQKNIWSKKNIKKTRKERVRKVWIKQVVEKNKKQKPIEKIKY